MRGRVEHQAAGVAKVELRALSKPAAAGEILRLRGLVLAGGFVSLFNGVDLEGWDTRYQRGEGYVCEDGRIVFTDGGGQLWVDNASGFGQGTVEISGGQLMTTSNMTNARPTTINSSASTINVGPDWFSRECQPLLGD